MAMAPRALVTRRALLAAAVGAPLATTAALPGSALAQPAQAALPRLVTISGAITEVAYALGAQSHLVGTDTTSLYPAAAQKTPKVGYMRQLSAEGVLSLKPNAVIATTEAGPPVVLDQLRSAGLVISALTQREHLTEIVELPKAVHPWFIGVQFHPEFKSTPWAGHPLFNAFIKAAVDRKKQAAK